MISRVADQCFWFGRYTDRAESTARLLQATRTLVFDTDIPVTQCWQPLVIVSGQFPTFVKEHGPDATGNGEEVQHYMTWDETNFVSLASSIQAGRESARAIRDVLSLEVWEEVNELYLWQGTPEAKVTYRENREGYYRHVRRSTQLSLGLVRSTMLHDTPMLFLWLGVMLERVGQTARILDMHHHTMQTETAQKADAQHQIVETALWLSLLRACSGYESFMKKNQGRVTASTLVSFLVFDTTFPRSLRYCLRSALRVLRDIWNDGRASTRASEHRLEELCRWLDQQEERLGGRSIHELLTHMVDEMSVVCGLIAQEILGPPRAPKVEAQAPPEAKPVRGQVQTQ